MQRPCIENQEGDWTRVRMWKEGCESPYSHRPTAKKEPLRLSHSPEAARICFSFTGQMCGGLQVACIPTTCEEQILAQSYQERCDTMSGLKTPFCAMNLPFSSPLQTKGPCTPARPFLMVMTNSQGEQGNGKSILKTASFSLPPSSSLQTFVLLLDVKLMIPNPRCVMLSL